MWILSVFSVLLTLLLASAQAWTTTNVRPSRHDALVLTMTSRRNVLATAGFAALASTTPLPASATKAGSLDVNNSLAREYTAFPG
jgi:hypothetical protein